MQTPDRTPASTIPLGSHEVLRVLHLDNDTVAGLLDLPSVTDTVGDAFAALGRGEAATTQRVRAAAPAGMASAMAAVVPHLGVSGGKVYATVDGRFTFVVVLFDLDGRLLCTLDGDVLTRLRTPACSALAIRRLARRDSRRAALLGTGRHAWPHVEMLAGELELDDLVIWGRHRGAAAGLVERATMAGIPARRADTAAAAVTGADVVVTITAATEPLFGPEALGPATLVCAMGATKESRCEIDPGVVAACRTVVCDDVTGSRVECGDLLRAERAGYFEWHRAVELAAVLAGTVTVPRAGDAGPVLFESQGVALQDVAAAGLAWRQWRQRRLTPDDPPPFPQLHEEVPQ